MGLFGKGLINATYIVEVVVYQITKFQYCSVLFKAFIDDNFNVAQMAQFFFERLENNVGKGENAGHQHFLLSPPCFQRAFGPRVSG